MKPTFGPLLCAPNFFFLILSQIRLNHCGPIFSYVSKRVFQIRKDGGLRMSTQLNSNLFAAAAGPVVHVSLLWISRQFWTFQV